MKSLLPIFKNVKAKTVAGDLISVKPMNESEYFLFYKKLKNKERINKINKIKDKIKKEE